MGAQGVPHRLRAHSWLRGPSPLPGYLTIADRGNNWIIIE
jgi:hypothetical protein